MSRPSYVIFLNGSFGVGKSSMLDHVGDLLADAGRAFSLNGCRLLPPGMATSGGRPENVLTKADNMAAVWKLERDTQAWLDALPEDGRARYGRARWRSRSASTPRTAPRPTSSLARWCIR